MNYINEDRYPEKLVVVFFICTGRELLKKAAKYGIIKKKGNRYGLRLEEYKVTIRSTGLQKAFFVSYNSFINKKVRTIRR